VTPATATPVPARRRRHVVVREPAVYGLVAEFEDHRELIKAAERAREEGYRKMDAFSPFPIDEMPEALGLKPSLVPLLTLLGGISGGLGAYFMEWYSMGKLYAFNIGGRPLNSWPNFIPITFELTVLIASLSAFLSVFVLSKLPQPNHPLFNVPEFRRASIDRFFLCIEVQDPKFDRGVTWKFLQSLRPVRISEVLDE
jgi:Protein of unknown function (DUF3341)